MNIFNLPSSAIKVAGYKEMYYVPTWDLFFRERIIPITTRKQFNLDIDKYSTYYIAVKPNYHLKNTVRKMKIA